MSKSNFEKWFR